MPRLSHIYRLGIKELWSLWRDPLMLFLLVYTFSFAIYMAGTAMPDSLHAASLAVVDEDRSPLSARVAAAFYPPRFVKPQVIGRPEIDPRLDAGECTFALVIPPGFQRDVLAGRSPAVQLNVDATRMSQAFTGSGYIGQIVSEEVNAFVLGRADAAAAVVELALRARFNPALTQSWFGSVMELIGQITVLSMMLTGAALIRERERGTVEHLLVMPVTPAEIMLAKIWSMGAVVLVAAGLSLMIVVREALGVRIEGSLALFFGCAALHMFATTSLGIFLATLSRTMPQFALLMMLTLMPIQMLSGMLTPRESMPEIVRHIMLVSPTTHFVAASQAILYRGAGLAVVWPYLLSLAGIGAALFAFSLGRFRTSLQRMA